MNILATAARWLSQCGVVFCFHGLLVLADLDPVVITPEEPDSLDQGQDLSLSCNALSSLDTNTSWYKVDLKAIAQIFVYAFKS